MYKDVLNTYNSAKYNALFLHRCSCTGNLKRFHHVQDKVWYNPCLCLHIILRCYFDWVKNYKPNTMYDKIKCSRHVHVRNMVYVMDKGRTNFFSAEPYPKASSMEKHGLWMVDGTRTETFYLLQETI